MQVHGIEDTGNDKPSPNNSKVGVDSIPENIKDWKLVSIGPTEESRIHVSTLTESSVVDERSSLISNENMSSRVVKIVLNDSHQAVATVTLGGTESVLPENWYE